MEHKGEEFNSELRLFLTIFRHEVDLLRKDLLHVGNSTVSCVKFVEFVRLLDWSAPKVNRLYWSVLRAAIFRGAELI